MIISGIRQPQPAVIRFLTSILLAVVVASTSCRRDAGSNGRISVVDDAGDTVSLAAPARRVVSLIPATTELLFAIGGDSLVVGRTTYCDYPAAVRAIPDLGDGIKPNIEAIVARRPDLVVLYNSGQNAGVTSRLRELGVSAVRVNTDALSSVPRLALMLGKLIGHEHAADSLAAAFDTALASATQPAVSRRPKVLLLVWEQPPMTVGQGSFLNELLERAGGENLFADVMGTDGVVSLEAVAARDPDLIFTTAQGPSAFASRPEWQTVPAVRQKRFLHVSGSQFDRPSPRSPMAIRELSAMLNRGHR
jgi:iron complex transport system substrate-binding protein